MSYTTRYPPAHNDTYVKATSRWTDDEGVGEYYYPWQATNPALSLIGIYPNKSWISANGQTTNQRFHIDLGSAEIVRRIYYENSHYAGGNGRGVKDFTFWGSNNAAAFAELIYGTDTNWTQLTTSQSTFDQHVAADQADPKYITVTNTTAYRYYAFKFANNWPDYLYYMAVRHIALQTEDVVVPTVTTGAATNIRNNSAVGNGNVTSDGGGTITARGICYGTSINPTTAGTKVVVAGTTGVFGGALSNLQVGKRYYARTYATNWMGTSYGANVEFTTGKPLLMIF